MIQDLTSKQNLASLQLIHVLFSSSKKKKVTDNFMKNNSLKYAFIIAL